MSDSVIIIFEGVGCLLLFCVIQMTTNEFDDKEIEPKEQVKKWRELKIVFRELYPNYSYVIFCDFGKDLYGLVKPSNERLSDELIKKYRRFIYKDLIIN
jgi:hypothetical protein